MMFEKHSLKVDGYTAIVPRCHHHTRYEATMCPAQILTSQPSNTTF